MYRTTTTVTTLAVALLLASTVSTGVLAAAGEEGPTATASMTTSFVESSTFEPQQREEPATAPTPEATQLAPSSDPIAEDDSAPVERASATAATTPVSATTPPATARPQPTTPSAPLSAQPAPFTTATPSPSTPACATAISGTTPSAPGRTSPLGVGGTTTGDLQSFATAFNAIRVANCLAPVPFANFRYDRCMEDRLFWMAEDPSTDPLSAWGHTGVQRSDGLPIVGCDGNLAGGANNDGTIVAQKWWDSTSHRASIYKPTYTGSTARVCILFAMSHGGVPNEPYSFVRSAARWVDC